MVAEVVNSYKFIVSILLIDAAPSTGSITLIEHRGLAVHAAELDRSCNPPSPSSMIIAPLGATFDSRCQAAKEF
jgi:hypothetical protein